MTTVTQTETLPVGPWPPPADHAGLYWEYVYLVSGYRELQENIGALESLHAREREQWRGDVLISWGPRNGIWRATAWHSELEDNWRQYMLPIFAAIGVQPPEPFYANLFRSQPFGSSKPQVRWHRGHPILPDVEVGP